MLKQLWDKAYIYYIKKKQRVALINITRPCYINTTATFNFPSKITIGKYCRIGHKCHIDGEGTVEIGDGTILAPHIVILSSSHNYKTANLLPYGIEDNKLPVIIGKGCWIGWGAMIGPGVTVGDGAVIAMGSVVTKNVEAGKVVGGNPAKIINTRNSETDIAGMIVGEKFFLKEMLEKNLVRKGRKTKIKKHLFE